jgi:hypothetical protein
MGILEDVAISVVQASAVISAGVIAAAVTVAGTLLLAWLADVEWGWRELVKYPVLWIPVVTLAGFMGIAASKTVWIAIV